MTKRRHPKGLRTSKYKSGLEQQVGDLMDELGVIYEYESTKVPYVLCCNYTPDFALVNGIFLETKGLFTAEDRRKMLAVKRDNPDLDVRMVFQAPFNRINKRSKTTYAMWCENNDIKWAAFHSIPIEWLT